MTAAGEAFGCCCANEISDIQEDRLFRHMLRNFGKKLNLKILIGKLIQNLKIKIQNFDFISPPNDE